MRAFLLDNCPAANLLLDDYEFSSEEIRSAVSLCVDKWNELPPAVEFFTEETFPWRFHLLHGVAGVLMTSAAVRYMRNAATMAVEGGSLDDQSPKGPAYVQMANQFKMEYNTFIASKKNEINSHIGWAAL